jgi:TonB family protein
MKNLKSVVKSLIGICIIGILFSCEQQPIDPSLTLDEELIPEGYTQSEKLTMDTQTRLEELRLENPDNHYYYLKSKNAPVASVKELVFPQKELLIEYAEENMNSKENRQLNGVIVKRIEGEWAKEEFKFYDQQPEAVGGMKSLYAALSENIKYPEEAKKEGIQGKVFVEFVVSETGTITNVKVIKGIGHGCDEEAVRVIEKIGKWIPAKIMDNNVSAKMIIPITYKLGNK